MALPARPHGARGGTEGELRRKLDELERQHHALSVLYQAYGEMNAAPNLEQAVRKLLDYALRESAADEGLVGLLDDEGVLLEVRARTPGAMSVRLKGSAIDLLASPLRDHLGGRLSVGEVGGGDRPAALFAGSQRQALLPVKSGEAVVAVVVLESRRPDAFEALDELMLERLAEQAGTVLATRNFLERSRKEMDLLWDVSAVSDLQHELDQSELDELLAKILEIALGRCRMKNGTILLVDEETGDLIIESRSLRGDFLRRPPFRLKRRQDRPSGIAFWVVDHNKPYVTGDIRSDPNYVPMFREVRSNVAVPIPFQDRAIGALVLESVKPDAFGPPEVRLLEDLARQAAKFVRRAQLYRKSREMDQRGIMIRGLCPEWEEAEQILERVSNTGATVLLRGESGTGKELIANALHFNSRRSRRQFVVVNCAAIPGELLESELFGHVKGAFTGAAFGKIGEFEKADGGTLFLDEIGDLTLPLQVKLLRALQSGEIAKVGSSDPPRRVDVRVIAATNRDLERMMREGRFREDLYFRLNVVTVWLPPLRRYRDSIPGMVKAFIEEASRIHGRAVKGIEPPALALLKAYAFPGNVRELKNLVERAVILEPGDVVTARFLPPEVRGDARASADPGGEPPDGADALSYKEARLRQLEAFEDRFLRTVMARAAGNVKRASELSGIHRVNLHRMLARRAIDPRQFKP